jgi:3-hydroxyisobutyrate dehydrogenase
MANDSIRTVGYIGMGIMGSAMAANLLKAGFDVTVWNRTTSKCDPLKTQGAKVADSPADMAQGGPDIIFTNVTNSPDVEAVLFGDDGVASTARAGLVVIDNSTISPIETQKFCTKLAEQDVTLLDAPVSGGDVGAKNGTLAIMVGGDETVFNKVMPAFEAMGKTINLLGPSGMGQVCKACNQICVSVKLLAVCEAFVFAQKSGLDLHKLVNAIGGGAAASWQLTNLGPKVADGDYDPGFMIDLVLKDLGIIADASKTRDMNLKATTLATEYFQQSADQGNGADGTQAMAKAIEKAFGVKFS